MRTKKHYEELNATTTTLKMINLIKGLVQMLKLFDEFMVKIGVKKKNSPKSKTCHNEHSNIIQESVNASENGIAVNAGGGNVNIAGRDVIINGPSYTFTEKKNAAENLQKGIRSFFYSALGKDGEFGFLSHKNLDESGQIKSTRVNEVRMMFDSAKKSLKTCIKENAPFLKEQDQMELHKLLDQLTLLKDVYKITEALKNEITMTSNSLLEKYS